MRREPTAATSSPAALPPGDLTLSLARLSGMVRRHLGRRLAEQAWVAESNLRPPGFGVLHLLEAHQPISQKEISDRLGTDPSDLVAVFDLLASGGFIARERDPGDRRRYSLTITPAGRRLLRRFESVAADVQDELFAPLDTGEREVLFRLVQRVLSHHAP